MYVDVEFELDVCCSHFEVEFELMGAVVSMVTWMISVGTVIGMAMVAVIVLAIVEVVVMVVMR